MQKVRIFVGLMVTVILFQACGGKMAAHRRGSSRDSSSHSSVSTDLYSKTFGNKNNRPVIFLHGGPGSNSWSFEVSAAQALADKGFFVITYDQRGSARSPAGTAADYNYAGSTRDLAALIKSYGLHRPLFAAHSYGGSVALKFLDAHPNVAAGAVLIASPMNFPDIYYTVATRCADIYQSRGMTDYAREMLEQKARMFPNGLNPPYSYSAHDIGVNAQTSGGACRLTAVASPSFSALEMWTRALGGGFSLFTSVNTEVGNAFHVAEKIGYANLTPLLAKHKSSVYGIYGDEDGMFSSQHLAEISGALLPGRYTVIRGASHFLFLDKNAEFINQLAADLNAISP